MDLIRKEDLASLAKVRQGPCLSIYIPTFRATSDTLQNPTRLKNRLREAEKLLADGGRSNGEVKELLEPLREMLDNHDFWQHQSDGLAIFRSPDFLESYRLPISFEELASTSQRFHLKPLLPMLTNDGRFYILSISQGSIRLFNATRYTVQEIELPESVKEIVMLSEKAKQSSRTLQHHAGAGADSGKSDAMFHGQGGAIEDNKQYVVDYFREVDRSLQEILHDEKAPMILAGVEYLHPLYASANTYRTLLDEGIHGNVEEEKPEALHKKALEIIVPLFEQEREKAAEAFQEAEAHGRGSHDLRKILRAAHDGRIDTLLVALGKHAWGSYDPSTDALNLHDEKKGGDDDLFDVSAVQTLVNGGTVYAVEPDEMPAGSVIAATMRY